jgi:hypothetical protein
MVLAGRTADMGRSMDTTTFYQQMIGRGKAQSLISAAMHPWSYLGSRSRAASAAQTWVELYQYMTARLRTRIASLSEGTGTGGFVDLVASGAGRITAAAAPVVRASMAATTPVMQRARVLFRMDAFVGSRGSLRGSISAGIAATTSLTGRIKNSFRDGLADYQGFVLIAVRTTTRMAIRLARQDEVNLMARSIMRAAMAGAGSGAVLVVARSATAVKGWAVIGTQIIVTAIFGRSGVGMAGRATVVPAALMGAMARTAAWMNLSPAGRVVIYAASWTAAKMRGMGQSPVQFFARSTAMATMRGMGGAITAMWASSAVRVSGLSRPTFFMPLVGAVSQVGQIGGAVFRWANFLVASGWNATLGQVQSLNFLPLPNLYQGRYVCNCHGRVRTVFRILKDDPCDCGQ